MTKLISASPFASAYPAQNIAQHAVITDDDAKICTLSHQLFSLKKLVKSYYEWCRSGVMPAELQEIITKTIEKASSAILLTDWILNYEY